MNEFGLIGAYFARPARKALLGVGDDCALLAPPTDEVLAISVDMLVEGRHFFSGTDPRSLGHKALAVNLSDLAAMGAKPAWFTLALALPRVDEAWLAEFSSGLFALADAADIELVGGDTTRGPLTLSIQVAGHVPAEGALRRSGAKAGDDVWVSGSLGAAAMAVRHRSGDVVLPDEVLAHCAGRLDWPMPRLALGAHLRRHASAALDVSDGLVGDLVHICEQSGLGADLDWECIPVDPALQGIPEAQRRLAALSGGDDYELCFTANPKERQAIEVLSLSLGLPLTRIGVMRPGAGVTLRDINGCPVETGRSFDHFSSP
ncbi:thiamine-phosphate kinase [Jeongeupia naejangsanensis]|uniref:Thiamine-monophosphate kinase n=1 Tax=Jeongeupia naejangsanensis TaxID=613195 RepID=A0ABS2BJF7_9NEIS|nr:thiamine-phosphate kinase [Jeongeupia naejangsanensis]MBM3115555.1 thiamine-phosphate kinase [Jeongeupia naejangsanensis]